MTKQKYRIREGADTINGARVPDSRIVQMTAGEADYYQSIGVAAVLPAESAPKSVSSKRSSKAASDNEA